MATLASTYNARRYPSRAIAWEVAPPDREPKAVENAVAPEIRSTPLPRPSRSFSTNVRPALFSLVNVSHFLLAWGLRGGIALFLVLFGLQLPHPERWDGTWLTLQLRTWGDPIVAGVAAWTGFQWPSSPSMSFLPLGLALAVWFVKVAADAGSLRIQTFLRPPVSSTLKAQDPATLPAEGGVPEAVDSEHAREDLLRRYREIEGALRAAKRKRCAFLSIDVAGSTVMKESEQAMAVDVTFQAYMNMLEDVFARYGAWKQTWTPDGVMVCFLQVDVAVAAAQSVLRRLRKFNRSENLLKTRISVRCGLNEGEVPIFEDSKLEKIAHQVLDVTGHMQKHANPDTLWLSAEVFKRLDDKSGFRPASKEVDGHQVYEWSARLAAPQPAPAFPALQPRPGNSDPTWY